MSIITTRISSQQITVEQYVSTLPYEMMPLKENFFTNIVNNENIQIIFKGAAVAITTEEVKDTLESLRKQFIKNKNKDIEYNQSDANTSLKDNVIKKELLNYLLQYRFSDLYSSTEEIASAKSAFVSLDNKKDLSKEAFAAKKADIKKRIDAAEKAKADALSLKEELKTVEKQEQLVSNKTLYILPKINLSTSQSTKSNLNVSLLGEYKNYYSDIFNSSDDNIFFLSVFSLNNEDISSFKTRMEQEIIDLSEKIKNKGRDDSTAYNKIVYFINNTTDKFFYTDFFKLTLKKEFITELNNKLKNFFTTRIGDQTLRLNSTPYYNDIEKLKSDIIIRNLRAINDKWSRFPILSDNLFKSAVQLLVDSIKNCYLSYTDAKFRKSLSENANINTFNIYSRLENLDDVDPMNEIVASNEHYYIFLEIDQPPRVGKIQVSNVAKNQYFFVVDRNKGVFKKWRTKVLPNGDLDTFNADKQETWSAEYTKYNNDFNKKNTKPKGDDEPFVEMPIDPEELEKQERDANRILIQVRYNYGQIQFKNIQEKINSPFTGVIKFLAIVRSYEQYDWFKFNTIDRTFDKIKTEINYYSDTLFDIPSLKAFLKSENKLNDKTRLSLEFLKLNVDIAQLKKYSDFIYDNFKGNVNTNINDKLFEEKVKKNIIDIVFEKNGLIYVKTTNIVADKEKEKADADNFKIINCKYTTINKSSIESDIKRHFDKNNKEEGKHLRDRNKNIKELTSVCKQDKKTCGIAIIQITRDVIGDSTQLLISAECKKRTRRIKNKIQQAFDYMFQGGRTMPKRNKRTRYKRSRKYYRT